MISYDQTCATSCAPNITKMTPSRIRITWLAFYLKKQPFHVHKKLSKIPTSSMRELKIGILFSWTKGKKSEKLFGILILVVIA